MKINKLINLFGAATISAVSTLPIVSCSVAPFYAVAKSSLYVGEFLKQTDILVMNSGKEVPYDETGDSGWKIVDDKYNIGYCFTDDDIGSHKVKVVYKEAKMDVTLTVTAPKVITPKFPLISYTSRFFKTPKIANKIYVVDVPDKEPYKSYRNQWYVLLQSLEGILAQTEARLFVNHDVPQRNSWLVEAQKQCGFTTEAITPEEAIEMFKDVIKDKKLVLYSGSDSSLNNATVISACDHYLMCDNGENFLNKIKEFGFTVGVDAYSMTSKECFNAYKDKLSPKLLINQDPTNIWLRDYAIASKSFTTYLDNEYGDTEFQKAVLEWLDANAPVLGWTKNELKMVDLLSQYNKVIMPSDNCANLSLFSAYKPKENSYQVHKEKIIPQVGKHYIALVMSDGDNIQWIQNDWFGNDWFGNSNRGSFPMNWTINPSLLDVNPQILDRINSIRTTNDYFVCSGSGYGYINYSKYPERKAFSISSSEYMKNTDLTVGYYLDPTVKNPQNYKEAFEQSQLTGGVFAFGDRYAEGKGGVYWLNNKPLVCCRETLWQQDGKSRSDDCFSPENMAARINNYSTNPNEISGYTIVNCHCWSFGKMDEVKKMVDKLDDHVEIVTLEQIIQMIFENVPHVDVEAANDYPPYYK